ncbi:MAG: ABC transporter permease [Bacteroidales bacterium]|nr:MAG: ABC transporter permease [Bacteroidales bacterium]
MLKLGSSIRKEILVLVRDMAGLAILFIMPMVLIFVMTLIQDTTFRKLDESNIPVLLVNEDRDSLGLDIEKGLSATGFFSVITILDKEPVTEDVLRTRVAEGDFQMGIVVKSGATDALRTNARILIKKALEGESGKRDTIHPAHITVYFDPVIKNSFKQSMINALGNFTSRVESKITFQTFAEEIDELLPEDGQLTPMKESGIHLQEIYATNEYNEVLPNSVQHNVPAWTVFAMFFIIIPLTGNIIKEREDGSAMRLKLMPGSYLTVLLSKIIVYVTVCFLQFVLMLLVGMVFLPMLGLPSLELGQSKETLVLLSLSTALAATGYGVLIGTIATSHEQAASFGSVSVIILAAIGGIWVPVYMMPDIMKTISIISPLNWSMEGFYNVFLRGAGIKAIMSQIVYLLIFFVVTMLIAFQYERMKTSRI